MDSGDAGDSKDIGAAVFVRAIAKRTVLCPAHGVRLVSFTHVNISRVLFHWRHFTLHSLILSRYRATALAVHVSNSRIGGVCITYRHNNGRIRSRIFNGRIRSRIFIDMSLCCAVNGWVCWLF